jgi:hypothetical protein
MMSAAQVRDDPDLRQELLAAFESAFPTRDALRHFLRHRLRRNLEMLSGGVTIDVIIGDLIYREDEGDQWLVDLVQAAYRHRPANPLLVAFTTKAGWLPPETLPGLQEILTVPAGLSIVRLYGRQISKSCRWAHIVAGLKDLHDRLDTLRQYAYEPLRKLVGRLPAAEAVQDVPDYVQKFFEILTRLTSAARDPAFAKDAFPWLDEELAAAASCLEKTYEEVRPEDINKALAYMQVVLEKELTALDRSLADATRELNLEELVLTLESLQERLEGDGIAPERSVALGEDIQTLQQIEGRLGTLLEAHHRWQRVDARVNNLELAFRQKLDDVALAFELLKMQLAKLEPGDAAADALTACDAFGAAIVEADASKARLRFTPVSTLLRARFFAVDKALLDECECVRAVGNSLSAVVEKLDA